MPALLESISVSVRFDSLLAVDDVSFSLEGGQLLGLVGPNGAGKTTLMRVLTGLQAPTQGQALIMGSPILGHDDLARQHVGFAPDTPPLYDDLTIEQFLEYIGAAYDLSLQETRERIDFWLEELWLTDKRTTLIKNLSRGMRQRVALGRTFLPRPHVLLLDEPLSGLDPAGRVQLRGTLAMLREQGCAMIVSSHILADLEEVATHIAIIQHGRILRLSRSEELHGHEHEKRTYRLTLAEEPANCRSFLAGMEGVANLECQGQAITFDYPREDAAAAQLLARLVRHGCMVTSFGPVRRSLEEAYLKSGVKQVD